MADAPTFTLGSLALELYVDDDATKLGAPQREYGTVGNALCDDVEQTLDYVKEFREQTYPVRIVGIASLSESKRENCVRQLHNLDVELGKKTNTLVITRRGSSVETVYQVVRGDYPEAGFTVVWDRGGVMRLDVTLTVRSWALGAAQLRTLCAAQETPSVVDLTVPGSVPTPLELLATRGFSGSGLQTLIIGRIPTTFDLEDLLLLSLDSSCPGWDAFTASSGYVEGAGNVRVCTSTSYRAMYWDAALPVGRYSLFVRARVQTGGRGWLAQSRSSNDPSAAPVALSDTDWRFVRLGDYASDGYTVPRIVGKCREAENGILVDWLLAVPLDLGSPFFFHCTSHAVASVTSEWRETTMQLTSGATRSARRYVSGPGVKCVGASRLLVAACDANGNLRRPSVSLGATLTPRYVHWVPTTEV